VEAFSRCALQVRALVRETSDTRRLAGTNVERVHGSLEDVASLGRAVHDADVIIHLAALTRAHSEKEYHSANVLGTANLLAALSSAATRPRRLVYLSSMAAVGPSLGSRPVGPTDTPRPLTAYGRTKLAGEELCLNAAAEFEVVILRAPAVYGPRDRDLLHFFRLAARGFLPVPTGPDRPLQLVHVQDLADAVVRAGTTPDAKGIFHVADSAAYAWVDVVRLVASAVGVNARVVHVPPALIRAAAWASELAGRVTGRASIFDRDKARELLAPGWLCDIEPTRRALGFEPRIPLADGLNGTAQWYRDEGWL
jgi:nucleoside-diphosphate-sugar epimerase